MDLGSFVEPKQRAVELYNQRDYAGAAEEYRKAIIAEPHNHAMHRGLALAASNSNSLDEAIEAASRAADLQPSDAENQFALGYVLGKAARWEESIRALDSALFLNPNHAHAKQILVAALMEHAKVVSEERPREAVNILDRANKIDRSNPYVLAALLTALVDTGQKGHVINQIEAADARVKEMEPVKGLLTELAKHPDYETSMRQSSIDQRLDKARSFGAPTNLPGTTGPKQIPCPNCRQAINDFAAICPHCNFRIKATGSFANHDRGPDVIWQELALTIVGVIYSLLAVVSLVLLIADGATGLNGFNMTLAGGRLVIGLGLIFRWEWISFIAKIFLWLSVASNGFFAMLMLMAGVWVPGLIYLVTAGISAFLIYLINYCMD